MDNNRKIARWAGWERDGGKWYSIPGVGRKETLVLVDETHWLWVAVLLPLIREREIHMDFMVELALEMKIDVRGWMIDLLADGWKLITATPKQFATALTRVIDEEEDGESN